jgi:hypothetical protein
MEKVTKEAKYMVLRFYLLELFFITVMLVSASLLNLQTYTWGLIQGVLVALLTGFAMSYPQIKKALK